MLPFKRLEALALPLPLPNVDTDQLIPARFMRRPRSEGYGNFLLYDLRFSGDGSAKGDFPLNRAEYAGAQILVARRNFGCGSSREAAVYALSDYGLRVVIAPSFGDIFASNSVKNGLLPAQVSEEDAERLLNATITVSGRTTTVDLASQTISAGNLVIPFAIDPIWKKQLQNGWDDIDLTLAEGDRIAAFTTHDRLARPWMAPRNPASPNQ